MSCWERTFTRKGLLHNIGVIGGKVFGDGAGVLTGYIVERNFLESGGFRTRG